MKVTFLTPTLEIHGGNICMLKYADYLIDKGVEVTIITPDKPIGLKINHKIKIVQYNKFPIPWVDFFTFQLVYFWKIRQLINRCDYIIPIYTPLVISAIAAIKKYDLKAKIVLLYQEPLEMLWVGRYIKFILSLKSINKYISGTLAVSKSIAEQFENITNKKAIVINNGVEHNYFYDRRLPKQNYILFVGRPNKPKGFDIFVNAFQAIKKEYPTIKAKVVSPCIEKSKIKNLEFIVGNDREKMAIIYNRAMIFVNPSYAESFGLTSLEAMASKTAVILTNTQGSKEYAKNNRNCLVVPIGDEQQLTKNIIQLLNEPRKRKKLENNGLKTAQNFTWEKSTKKFLKYLKELV